GRQMVLHFCADRFRQTMKLQNFVDRRFVERAANGPALDAIAVEIALAQIFDPDEAFRRIVKINFRGPNAVGVEEFRDLDVVPIFFALQIVFNKNQSLVRIAMDSIKFAVRASLFNWPDFYLIDVQPRKMHSRLSEKQRRSHGLDLDVDVTMDAAGLFFGADNTTLKLALGSDFCVRPQNCVFEDCVCADSTMLSDNRAAAQFSAGIDNR